MQRFLLAMLVSIAVIGPASGTAPLRVAQVHRDHIGELAVDVGVGGWTFSENGRDLYVSGGDVFNVAGLLAHLTLDPASGALTLVDAVRDDRSPIAFGGFGGATALGPGETQLYYESLSTTAVFGRDPIGGGLVLLQSLASPVPEQLHAALRVTPDGQQVLATSHDGITAFDRGADGLLGSATPHPFVESEPQDPSGPLRSGAFVMRDDGRVVYGLQVESGFGNRNAVVVLERDDAGGLAVVQRVTDGFDDWVSLGTFAPRSLALSPDGRFLYAGDWLGDGGVIAFALDDAGRVRSARVYGRPETPGTTCIAVSPDGGLLYTNGGGALGVWARDVTTGAIEEIQRIATGDDGAALDGLEHITTSPDGRFVLTLATLDHAVTVLQRRCGDGVVEGNDVEECDDGNAVSGDGCDAACRVEPCHTCAGAPSVCAPAGGTCDDGNPCTVSDVCPPRTAPPATTATLAPRPTRVRPAPASAAAAWNATHARSAIARPRPASAWPSAAASCPRRASVAARSPSITGPRSDDSRRGRRRRCARGCRGAPPTRLRTSATRWTGRATRCACSTGTGATACSRRNASAAG
jgi:cysteine-rich repeat protein